MTRYLSKWTTVVVASTSLLVAACRTSDGSQDTQKQDPEPNQPATTQETSAPARGARPAGAPKFVEAPDTGDVPSIVKAQLARTKGMLIVYVGAPWCEPCQRFHHAIDQGELDTQLPGYTFLAFDMERDRERLLSAGYTSHFIPLFVVPNADGKASDKHIEGSIKGSGAPGQITPRLLAMVAGK